MLIRHHGVAHLPAAAVTVTDNSLSAMPGGESELVDMHNPHDVGGARWLIPLDTKGIRVIPPGGSMFVDLAEGSTMLAEAKHNVAASGKYLSVSLPGYNGPSVAVEGNSSRVTAASSGAVFREVLDLGDRAHIARVSLRNEYPQMLAQSTSLVICVVLRGYAMAMGWRPGEDDSAMDVLGHITDANVLPIGLIRMVESGAAETLQHALQLSLRPASSGGLRDDPDIGSQDSRLLLAQPLMPHSVLVIHPGDMVALSSVVSWSTPEMLILTTDAV